MKKILPLLVVGILVLSGLGAVAFQINIDSRTSDDKINTSSLDDELDQYQTEMTENIALPIGQIAIPDNPQNVQIAQSFIPTKLHLTRIELLIGKNSTATYPLVVEIRKELDEEYLTQLSVDPSSVPTEEYDWVEIDFADIPITIGETYYIVTHTVNETDNFYAWGGNNLSESYPNGCMWYSLDDGDSWGNKSATSCPTNYEEFVIPSGQTKFDEYITWDTCFKTYGKDNNPPSTPKIEGSPSGNPGVSYTYTFTSTDPDGDDITYLVDWGDGNNEWTSYYPSGTPATVSHSWSNSGNYIIKAKAKDVYGAESDWGRLDITIPRCRAMNNLLLKILQNHPFLFLILELLLKAT